MREDLSLPSAVPCIRDRLEHNLAWMQRFMDAYKIKLAPHGKTTMAPRLFQMQMDGGAWGITLASAHQVMVAHAHGIHRVLLANQLVGRRNMQMIADVGRCGFRVLLPGGFGRWCKSGWASSFLLRGLQLNVLLELGVTGGRCGVRDDMQLQFVIEALTRCSEMVHLAGVELYEGVLKDEESIRNFMRRACEVTRQLLEQ